MMLMKPMAGFIAGTRPLQRWSMPGRCISIVISVPDSLAAASGAIAGSSSCSAAGVAASFCLGSMAVPI